MNKILFLIICLVVVGGVGVVLMLNNIRQQDPVKIVVQKEISSSPTPEVVNFTASFAIFTQGTFRVFTAAMYHNQDENKYIESSNPNIIHVKKSNVTWDDFFKTLPFSLKKDCLVTGTGQTFCTNSNEKLGFYINGVNLPDALDQQINPGDQLLVSYGDQEPKVIQNQFRKIPTFSGGGGN